MPSDGPARYAVPVSARPRGIWFVVAAVLVAAFAVGTRLAAPWRLSVTNDEMRHLECWRNQYRTDDIFPLFLEKLERGGWLAGDRLEMVRDFYESGPLAQRACLVLVDGHPPFLPVLAEIIEAVTHSNLAAARLPSALASLLSVFLMYRLGRALVEPTLGLWLAALLAISLIAEIYAGIARPYALAQCGTILAFLVFVREQQASHRSPWRLWLAVLFAQSLHWLTWALVGPLVLIELVRRLRAGQGIGSLFRQTWWYALISVSILGLLAVHLSNPGISEVETHNRWLALWTHFAVASPFAAIDHVLSIGPFALFSPAALALLFMALFGFGCVVADRQYRAAHENAAIALPGVRLGLILLVITSAIAPIALFTGPRFMLIFVTGFIVFAGIGAHWLLRPRIVAQTGVVVLLLAFGVLRIARPANPYDMVLWNETDYRPIAAHLKASLAPGDAWCAYPYFWGDCLYPYGPLPAPVRPYSDAEFAAFLDTLPRPGGATYVLMKGRHAELYRTVRRADEQQEFFNDFVVSRIPPAR